MAYSVKSFWQFTYFIAYKLDIFVCVDNVCVKFPRFWVLAHYKCYVVCLCTELEHVGILLHNLPITNVSE